MFTFWTLQSTISVILLPNLLLLCYVTVMQCIVCSWRQITYIGQLPTETGTYWLVLGSGPPWAPSARTWPRGIAGMVSTTCMPTSDRSLLTLGGGVGDLVPWATPADPPTQPPTSFEKFSSGEKQKLLQVQGLEI